MSYSRLMGTSNLLAILMSFMMFFGHSKNIIVIRKLLNKENDEIIFITLKSLKNHSYHLYPTRITLREQHSFHPFMDLSSCSLPW